MSTSNDVSSLTSMFNVENYHICEVKMEFFLRSQEKIMVSVPKKFEAKISTIEESCDLQTLAIRVNKQASSQKQRVSMRNDEVVENTFRAKHNGRHYENL
ncbi:hypothetical protein CR513_05989, partial [Mucuna pruriens]